MSLNYVIWNVTPQIIDLGKFEIRYYSLLICTWFCYGLYHPVEGFLKNRDLTVELLDRLTIYMVISTIIGARVGHCLFYEFDYYIQHPSRNYTSLARDKLAMILNLPVFRVLPVMELQLEYLSAFIFLHEKQNPPTCGLWI